MMFSYVNAMCTIFNVFSYMLFTKPERFTNPMNDIVFVLTSVLSCPLPPRADIVQRRWASGPSSTFFQSCSSHRKLWVIGPCFGGNQKSLRISVCMSVCMYVCMYCVYYLFNLLMGIHPIVWLSPVGSGNPLFHLIISLQLVIVLHRRIMCSQR